MHPNSEPNSVSLGTKASVQDVQEPGDLQKGALVSAELLHSLPPMVNGLQDSVSTSQTQLSLVQNDLSTLKQNYGDVFTLFPKLPLELRRKAWYYAYRAPQLHLLNDWDASRSELNSVFNSCSEAREVGQSLELDYFVFGYGDREEMPSCNRNTGNIRNYVNLNVDTLWVTIADPYIGLPTNIVFVCGKCHRFWQWGRGEDKKCCKSCLVEVSYSTPFKRLAINFRDWQRVGVPLHSLVGSLWGLFYLKVEELLFVVGDYEQFLRTRDIDFVAPSQPRTSISNAFSHCEERDRTGYLKTWPEMEEDLQGEMRDYKAKRAAELEAVRIQREEEGIDFENRTSGLGDLSGWEIPKVRFVEVRAASRKLVAAPAEEATTRFIRFP